MKTASKPQRKNPPKRADDATRFTFQVSKADLEKFRRAAKRDERSLSSWIRLKLSRQSGDGEG